MKGQQELKPVEGLTPVDEEAFRKEVEGAQGRLVCWTIAGGIDASSLQHNLDIAVINLLDMSRIAGCKGVSAKIIAVAEAAGYSQEICSYHRVVIGYALLIARGQTELVPEIPTVPQPGFIWTDNGCTCNRWTGEAVGRILDVPVMGPDMLFEYDVANREEKIDYVESQLRESLDVMETWAGRPLDWPRLQEHLRGVAEVAAMRNEVHEIFKTCRPSVCSAFDLLPATFVYRTGEVEEGKAVYEALKEEIQGKIERGERDVPEEKIRIAWHGEMPWGKIGAIRELLARHGATLCSSFLTTSTSRERRTGLDVDNPLRTVARMIDIATSNKSIATRIGERAIPSVEGYDVDGIVFNQMRTCKVHSVIIAEWAAQMERKLGVPTLIVEADAVDPAFNVQTQIEDRLQAFLERIAARKARV